MFGEFLSSGDTLRVYRGDRLVFSSTRDRLLPLLEYLERLAARPQRVVIIDKLMGNAAALLSIKAGGREVFSPLGSQLAVATLKKYGIKYHLDEIVPYIRRDDGQAMCPMEQLSIGKTPEEFYKAVSDRQGLN